MSTQNPSVENQFAVAVEIIDQHNTVAPDAAINSQEFLSNIKRMGGTNEERLRGFSYEEILSCMPSDGSSPIKPVAIAKDIAKKWRGSSESKDFSYVSGKKADRMSVRELIEVYDPSNSDDAVGNRLKKISKDQKFIVFSSGQTVDVPTTLSLLEDIKKGFKGLDVVTVGDQVRQVYKVGESPDNLVAENPFYPGRPLRPFDESCDQTNRSWSNIPMRARQLIRIGVNFGYLQPTLPMINDYMDALLTSNWETWLRNRHANIFLKYKELSDQGTLPRLLVPLIPSDFAKNAAMYALTNNKVDVRRR